MVMSTWAFPIHVVGPSCSGILNSIKDFSRAFEDRQECVEIDRKTFHRS